VVVVNKKYGVEITFFLQFYMLEFCSFHSAEPEFPNIQFRNSTLPVGEYPCCNRLAVRFLPLQEVSTPPCQWGSTPAATGWQSGSSLYKR
jgi:hypothetical protein